jgi:hypothetical protein
MSDDLLDRLARENPLPEQLPALPIEPLLRRLDAEAGATPTPSRDAHTPLQPAPEGLPTGRVQSRRDVSRRARRTATAIPILLSVLVVAGITVLAITTLSHRQGTTAPGSAPESSRAELLQSLGILRRPQTRSDLASMLRRGAGGAAPAEFLPLSPSARNALCPRLRPVALRCSLELDKSLVRANQRWWWLPGRDLSGRRCRHHVEQSRADEGGSGDNAARPGDLSRRKRP